MVVVWRGTGLFLLLAFIAALVVCNLAIFTHYSPDKFSQLNWWLPCLLSGVVAWPLADFSARMSRTATPATFGGRVFLQLGTRHSVFWIPVRYWTFIFIGIAGWQLIRR